MEKSILKSQNPRAKLSHYPHDLSSNYQFTSSFGHILPVMWDHLDPGDRVQIGSDVFTRTQPLKTPAFVRCTEHVYYFFVPTKLIDGYSDSAFHGIRDIVSSALYTTNSGTDVPQLPLKVAVSDFHNLRDQMLLFKVPGTTPFSYLCAPPGEGKLNHTYGYYLPASDRFLNAYGIPFIWDTLRLMSMLGYGQDLLNQPKNDSASYDSSFAPLKFDLHPLFAYQRIWFDFFRRDDWSTLLPRAVNMDYFTLNGLSPEYSNLGDDATSGNPFVLRYHPLKRDYFTSVIPSPLFDAVSDISSYGSGSSSNQIGSAKSDPASLIQSSLGIDLKGISNSLINQSTPQTMYASSVSGQAQSIAFSTSTIAQLKLAYAYDRLQSITRKAGKHIDAQVLAHFGFKMPEGVKDEVYYIGQTDTPLQIGEVVSTATTGSGDDSSVLGELAGRGLSSTRDGRLHNFVAPCAGYIMALYSCIPDIDYASVGIDQRLLETSANKLPRPEFANLGYQPLYGIEAITSPYISSDVPTNASLIFTNPTVILGWVPRYQSYKLRYDRVGGAFLHTLSDWSMKYVFGTGVGLLSYEFYCSPCILDSIFALSYKPSKVLFSDADFPAKTTGDFSPKAGSYYCLSVGEMPVSSTLVSYFDLSKTHTSDVTFNPSLMYSRDPLLHNLHITYHKINYMSPHGE